MLRILAFSIMCTVLGACSSGPGQRAQTGGGEYPEPIFTAERLLPPDYISPIEIWDPWQGMNKRIYNFNYHFDQMVFLPVIHGYDTLVPRFARSGVTNFFNNFRDAVTLVNSALQLSLVKVFQSTGRVVTNTTFGLLGLIDVATMMDIPRPEEDFGQTLGHWGVAQGPYLVMPFLGPSNLRDGIGLMPDYYFHTVVQGEALSRPLRKVIFLFNAVDTRDKTAFRYYENGSAFEYETVRWLWSTKRELDVLK